MSKRKEKIVCKCRKCNPLPGHHAHPVYGYDLEMAKEMPCVICSKPIGEEPYVEDLGMARFGQMRFIHSACETPKMARARARMEKNWHVRKSRNEESEE